MEDEQKTPTIPFDVAAHFSNPAAPVELEIGVGKGGFLLNRAEQRPEVNFLGVEYLKPYAAYVADRLRRAERTNAKMLCCDAKAFVENCIPDQSLLRVHIYFPDPWPKRRHNRRRLIQRPFLHHLKRVLKIGGQLLIVTDHRDYFEQMRRVLKPMAGLTPIRFPKLLDNDAHIVGTNFEKKYIDEGRYFYSAALLRYA